MKYLNLDNYFSPFGKSIEYDFFTFHAGEPHIIIKEALSPEEDITITTRIRSFNDLGKLVIATDAIKRYQVKNINLFLPYFPGARQDRVINKGEALTVKVYGDIINSLLFDKVTILDPHSDVVSALLNNVVIKTNHEFVYHCLQRLTNEYTLVSPDSGALKKIYSLSQFLNAKTVIECNKRRDLKNGKLIGFSVYTDDLKKKNCVIVDDICDGGGTFIGIAEELRKKNAGKISLIVTHGIFSKGTAQLKNYFDHIFCTDSFKTFNNKNLIQVKLNKTIIEDGIFNRKYSKAV